MNAEAKKIIVLNWLIQGVLAISNLHSKASIWTKSKAWVSGQVGPCRRARVSDLQSFDLDRPAGPSQRVTCLQSQCWEVKCSLESLMSISLFVNFSSGLRFNSGELRELRTFWKGCCWDAKSKGASTFWIW